MKLANFTLNEDLVGLDINGLYLDIHNNYTFNGCTKNENIVELKWGLSKGDWVPHNIPNKLLIKIEEVTYFDKRGNISDFAELDEMGFFENSSQGKVNYSGSFVPEENASLFVFRFIGGAEIAILGAKAKCFVQ